MRLSTILKLVVTCALGLLFMVAPANAATTTPAFSESALTSSDNHSKGQAIYVQNGTDPEATGVDTTATQSSTSPDKDPNSLLATINDVQERFMLGPLLVLTFLGGLIGLCAVVDRFVSDRKR